MALRGFCIWTLHFLSNPAKRTIYVLWCNSKWRKMFWVQRKCIHCICMKACSLKQEISITLFWQTFNWSSHCINLHHFAWKQAPCAPW